MNEQGFRNSWPLKHNPKQEYMGMPFGSQDDPIFLSMLSNKPLNFNRGKMFSIMWPLRGDMGLRWVGGRRGGGYGVGGMGGLASMAVLRLTVEPVSLATSLLGGSMVAFYAQPPRALGDLPPTTHDLTAAGTGRWRRS